MPKLLNSLLLPLSLCLSLCAHGLPSKAAKPAGAEQAFLAQIKLVQKLADEVGNADDSSVRQSVREKWYQACQRLIDLFGKAPVLSRTSDGDLSSQDLVRMVIDDRTLDQKDRNRIDQRDFNLIERLCLTAAKRSSTHEYTEVFEDCLEQSKDVLFRRDSFEQAEQLFEKCHDNTVVGSNDRLLCANLLAESNERAGHLSQALVNRQAALKELSNTPNTISEQALLARVQLANTLALCGKKKEFLDTWRTVSTTADQLRKQAEVGPLVTAMAKLALRCAKTDMLVESRTIFFYTLNFAQKRGLAYYVGNEGRSVHSALLNAGRYSELEQLLKDELAFYKAHMNDSVSNDYSEDLASLAECYQEHFYATLGEPKDKRRALLLASKQAYQQAFAAAAKDREDTTWQERKQAFKRLLAVF